MADGLADVYQLPLKPRLCGDCDNAFFGSTGVRCGIWNEDIWNEKVAQECEEFTPQPTGPVTIIKGGSSR